MNNILQEQYKTSRPLDVACYFGGAWDMDDIVQKSFATNSLKTDQMTMSSSALRTIGNQ